MRRSPWAVSPLLMSSGLLRPGTLGRRRAFALYLDVTVGRIVIDHLALLGGGFGSARGSGAAGQNCQKRQRNHRLVHGHPYLLFGAL